MDERKVAQEIDFSPLLREGVGIVVHCQTESDAIHFLKCLRKAYPMKCRTWKEDVTHWGEYDNMCYRPNLNMPEAYTLKYCNLEHYEKEGFTIIPYEELIIQPDIEESEQRLDLLLS